MRIQVGEILKVLTFVGEPHQFGLLWYVFIFDCFIGETGTGEAGEYYRFGFLQRGRLAKGIAILRYLVIVCLERRHVLRRDRRVLISRDEVCEFNPLQAVAERFTRIWKGNIFNNIHWFMAELLVALLLAHLVAHHFLGNRLLLKDFFLIHQLFHISILIEFQTWLWPSSQLRLKSGDSDLILQIRLFGNRNKLFQILFGSALSDTLCRYRRITRLFTYIWLSLATDDLVSQILGQLMFEVTMRIIWIPSWWLRSVDNCVKCIYIGYHSALYLNFGPAKSASTPWTSGEVLLWAAFEHFLNLFFICFNHPILPHLIILYHLILIAFFWFCSRCSPRWLVHAP